MKHLEMAKRHSVVSIEPLEPRCVMHGSSLFGALSTLASVPAVAHVEIDIAAAVGLQVVEGATATIVVDMTPLPGDTFATTTTLSPPLSLVESTLDVTDHLVAPVVDLTSNVASQLGKSSIAPTVASVLQTTGDAGSLVLDTATSLADDLSIPLVSSIVEDVGDWTAALVEGVVQPAVESTLVSVDGLFESLAEAVDGVSDGLLGGFESVLAHVDLGPLQIEVATTDHVLDLLDAPLALLEGVAGGTNGETPASTLPLDGIFGNSGTAAVPASGGPTGTFDERGGQAAAFDVSTVGALLASWREDGSIDMSRADAPTADDEPAAFDLLDEGDEAEDSGLASTVDDGADVIDESILVVAPLTHVGVDSMAARVRLPGQQELTARQTLAPDGLADASAVDAALGLGWSLHPHSLDQLTRGLLELMQRYGPWIAIAASTALASRLARRGRVDLRADVVLRAIGRRATLLWFLGVRSA